MTGPEPKVWEDVCAHLQSVDPSMTRRWFKDLAPASMHAGVITVCVDNSTYRDYLNRHCKKQFDESASAVTGNLVTVRFVSSEELRERASRPPAEHQRPAEQGGLTLNPDYQFEHFVQGPGNRLAHAAALAVAQNPGSAYNPFFVHGKVGLGKTHLLQAICLQIRAENPDTKIYYTSCEGFMTRFIEHVQAGRMADFRHHFRGIDVLAIDDVHFLAKRDRTQEEFFHTFNALHQAGKQIVLSSDAPPEDIPDLEDRLVSRFKWGLVTTVEAPGYETRIEIVKEKGRLRGLHVPDDVACFVAARVTSNIRELEGALTKLQLQSLVEGRDLDSEIAKAALGDEQRAESRRITLDSIISHVTDHFGVKLTDLQSKRRTRSIALPRQVCMYLARKYTRHSLEEIGGYFGGRDHTTVMHAVKTVEEKTENDPFVVESLEAIERQISPRAGDADAPTHPGDSASHGRDERDAAGSSRDRSPGRDAQPTA